MDPLTIMRRADGKLFTVKVKGQEHLALWPSLESALHYKKRNPQLLIFIPASVASPFGQKSLIPLRKENMGLFLVIDAGGSHLSDGRKIGWAELENSIPPSSSDWAYQLTPPDPNITDANLPDSKQAPDSLPDEGGKPIS
jgi:hypothetical protein